MKRIVLASVLLCPTLAIAEPIICPFSDTDQNLMRRVIDTVTGAESAPRGGIGNAQLGVWLTNKFAGQLPGRNDNCALAQPPAPPPQAPPPTPSGGE